MLRDLRKLTGHRAAVHLDDGTVEVGTLRAADHVGVTLTDVTTTDARGHALGTSDGVVCVPLLTIRKVQVV